MSFLIATPISHFFNDPIKAERIIRLSDCLEVRDEFSGTTFPQELLYHSHLEINKTLSLDDKNYLKKILRKKENLKLISMHLANDYSAPKISNKKFVPGGLKLSKEQMFENINNNKKFIEDLNPNIEILIENNNYFKTGAYDLVTAPNFMSEVVEVFGLNFLFDVSHSIISAFNRKTNFNEYFDQLPISKTRQIHFSKESFSLMENIMVDSHYLPILAEVKHIIGKVIAISEQFEFVTIEYYRDFSKLENLLESLQKLKNEFELP